MTPAKIQTALKEVADLSALVKEDEAEEEEERRKRGEVATKESLQSRNLVSPLFSEDEEKKRARAEDDEPNFQAVPLEQPVDDRVKRELLRIRGLLPPRGSRLNVTDDEYIRQNLPALMQTPDFVDLVREDASEVPESLTPELSKVFLKFAKKYKKLTPTEKEALFKDHATRFPLSIQRDEKGLRQPVDYDMTQMSLEERDAYERYKREGMAAERMYNRTQDDMARMNDIAETFGKRSRLVPDPIETDPLTGLPKTPTRGPFAGTEWEPESHRVGEMHRPLTPVRPVPKHMKDQFEQLALEQKFGEDDLALWREGKQETADRELIETLIGDSAENEGGGRENGEDMDVAQIGNMLAAAGGGKGAVSAKDVRAWVQKQKMSGLLRGFAGGEGKEGEEEQTKRISSSVGGVDDESDFLYATPDGDMMTQEELMQKMMQKEREASETAIEWKVGEAAAKARSVTGAAAVDWEGGPQSSNIFDISEFYSGQQQPPSPHSLQEAAAFADIEEVERYLKDQEVQRGRNPVSGSQENPSWYEQPGGGVGGELSRREDGDLDDDDIDPARMSEFRGEMGEDGEEWEPPGSGERKGSSGWSSTGKEPRMRGLR
uniref:Uncharacterized protein n=2 Tax=Chromera velia CCMP2878 TaxID=1169474 RepID=A0A0K6S5S9_9ALVE|eukprot:Cvel_14659.t1-p1 / transcript=Cvel_14659.t1 / gene=Cvel_14659 / organism=Chromera_velia_CCMP2878 / gene_product=hypothetical protein / transcript_product=hypothetical protein / location=Cvel_scaffold1050:51556-53364(-) / protein_length=603 / sequence_SO=supercontig / SO=protein_coding / is_pseudo=false